MLHRAGAARPLTYCLLSPAHPHPGRFHRPSSPAALGPHRAGGLLGLPACSVLVLRLVRWAADLRAAAVAFAQGLAASRRSPVRRTRRSLSRPASAQAGPRGALPCPSPASGAIRPQYCRPLGGACGRRLCAGWRVPGGGLSAPISSGSWRGLRPFSPALRCVAVRWDIGTVYFVPVLPDCICIKAEHTFF